jgi:hypothetical protein
VPLTGPNGILHEAAEEHHDPVTPLDWKEAWDRAAAESFLQKIGQRDQLHRLSEERVTLTMRNMVSARRVSSGRSAVLSIAPDASEREGYVIGAPFLFLFLGSAHRSRRE